MSLFSFLRKNKQESAADDKTFYSRTEEDSKTTRRRGKGGRGGRGDSAPDPVLPEKKRARRRLIGAVALVLAAVVGLPMILDSEPKPLGDDIAIQIPSKDKPAARTSDMVADSAALGDQEEVIEAPADNDNSSSAATPEKEAPKPEPQPQPRAVVAEKPAAPKPVPPKPVAEATPPKPERKPEPKPEVRHPEPQQAKVERKPEPVGEDARAKALLEGKPDPKAEQKNSGKYVIQVAALTTKEKVNELQSKLKEAGIKSYTQTIATGSGDRTRIRVGPFANKDEAEKVRAKIVRLGLNGTLVPA